MHRLRISRLSFVLLTSALFVAALAGSLTEQQWIFLVASVLLGLLTHPLGMIPQVIFTIPLIFFGIATHEECALLTAPFVIFAGYWQWYVALPRLVASWPTQP